MKIVIIKCIKLRENDELGNIPENVTLGAV